MSRTDASFDALRQAIQSLWSPDELQRVALSAAPGMLLLTLPNDVAAFSVFDGHPDEDFKETYGDFKRLYRENNRTWDERTLSFVLCRSSEHEEDDRFYASLEHDPLFCRKYVIRSHQSVPAQRDELLRLPFLPLRAGGEEGLQRPQSAQDFLQSAGVSASFSRKLVEAGHRSAERIALDLREGSEPLPQALNPPRAGPLAVTRPRASSRLVSLEVEGFRAYRDVQKFDLDASVIVLYGPNGLGKTSLFDAIDYASTGRIGRLCRQRRSQTEFSQIATHLDKTPGSGSVALTIRGGPTDSSVADWKLQRSTGDWSTAWVDGQEVDRKTILNRLTQANWLDTSPRQQTLESLFRATHLFGQDEQELLTEFQKGSVIPEAFISEMLALQDYSHGLSKVTDVIAQLSAYRSTIDQELTQVKADSNSLMASLPAAADSEGPHLTPIEGVIADLRQRMVSSEIALQAPPESLDYAAYSEWQEVVAARGAAAAERIQLAHTLRDELPGYQRLVSEDALLQKQLEDIDKQLETAKAEDREITRRIDANASALNEAEATLKRRQQRRQDLRSLSEGRSERHDLTKQIANLQLERDRQILERSDADARLIGTESALSNASEKYAVAERAVASLRTAGAELQSLLEDLPQFERDSSTLEDVQTRFAKAQNGLREAEERQVKAVSGIQSAKLARETLQPEYERALTDQADIDKLLDSIQGHVHDKSCPLCGSEFDSVEALLGRIRLHRDSVSRGNDVTTRYRVLIANEAQAADLLRVTSAEVSGASATIEELTKLRAAVEQRLSVFRTRLASFSFEFAGIEGLRKAINSLQEDLQKRLDSVQERAEAASHDLKKLQVSQADEATRRRTINERITTLERSIKEFTDRTSGLDARLSQILPGDMATEVDLGAEIKLVDKSIDEAVASVEQLRAGKRGESEKMEALTARKRGISQKREQVLSNLAAIHHSITEFRQKLRSIDVQDDVDAQRLDQVVQQEERRAELIRGISEKARVVIDALRAREVRLQLLEKQRQLEVLQTNLAKLEEQRRHIQNGVSICESIEKLLKRERQSSIERHIGAYGPMITMIQQRLRSVYGFGGVQLEARGGEAKVHVEWRSKSVQVPPTDFFSDSQRQILMLSIFLAGGLRQNWSGFAPVLLDDPVTHFDDLNAYGFVELVRGIIATSPNEWQFVISTCEERLFTLMQKKFSRLPSGAIFYEFLGMSEKGPMVERR